MGKAEVARRQLGTALDLFLRQLDPVSAHCLACGGGEIAERLAEKAGATTFARHARATIPDLTIGTIRKLRTQHWNAFKHATTSNGKDRDDTHLLTDFKPDDNEHWLFIGWHDYGQAGLAMPVEAQVFELWYFARYPEKANPAADLSHVHFIFPALLECSRGRQQSRLIAECRKARKNRAWMAETLTDPRPLVLP
jgi:hypothetical protein